MCLMLMVKERSSKYLTERTERCASAVELVGITLREVWEPWDGKQWKDQGGKLGLIAIRASAFKALFLDWWTTGVLIRGAASWLSAGVDAPAG